MFGAATAAAIDDIRTSRKALEARQTPPYRRRLPPPRPDEAGDDRPSDKDDKGPVNSQHAALASVRFASSMSIVIEDDFDKLADRLEGHQWRCAKSPRSRRSGRARRVYCFFATLFASRRPLFRPHFIPGSARFRETPRQTRSSERVETRCVMHSETFTYAAM